MCVYHCECEKQKPFFKAYEDRPRSLKEGTMTLRQNDWWTGIPSRQLFWRNVERDWQKGNKGTWVTKTFPLWERDAA